MKLDAFTRARVAVSRPLARAALAQPALRARLARHRLRLFPTLDEATAAMLRLDDLVPHGVQGNTVEAARRSLRKAVAISEDIPTQPVAIMDTYAEGPAGRVPLRIYTPPSVARDTPSPALIWFHGGGWATGDIDTHDALCRSLALQSNVCVMAPDYRLAPEHRFPAAADDALATWRYVVRESARLHVDPRRIAVGGDSAGANLSAVISLETRGEPTVPALQVLAYGAFDGTRAMPSHRTYARGLFLTREAIDWYLEHYLGGDRTLETHPRFSPLSVDDLGGAPPALVITAELAPLVDEGDRYAARLAEAGVVVEHRRIEGMVHGYLLFCGLVPAAKRETEWLGRAIGQKLSACATRSS